MNIKQLKYFIAVVQAGSFSAAADELYISQSSLSKQIIALEKSLELDLFDRGKRKIVLTDAGQTFLPHAQQLNRHYEAMLIDMATYQTKAASLSVAAIPVIAQYGITDHITRFRNAHPHVQFILEEREAFAILPALNSYQFDLAFMRDNYLDDSQYGQIKLSYDKFVLAVSANHPCAGKPMVSLAELSDENFIMFDKGTVVHELAVEACRNAGFNPRIFYASLRIESVLGMVASGNGVALMMEQVFNYHRRHDVVSVRLVETVDSAVVLAWLKNKKLSGTARIFIDFLKKLPAPPDVA